MKTPEQKAEDFARSEWEDPGASAHCQYSFDIRRTWLAGHASRDAEIESLRKEDEKSGNPLCETVGLRQRVVELEKELESLRKANGVMQSSLRLIKTLGVGEDRVQ